MHSDPRPPIHVLLDRLDWEELPPPQPTPPDGELYATHEGLLSLAPGVELRCYQLSDGQRVFSEEDVKRVFAGEP